MNLHKLLFPSYEERIDDLKVRGDEFRDSLILVRREIRELSNKTPEEMENLMRASLGLPYIRFDNIEKDTKGNDNPPHYLKGLDFEGRLSYIAELSQIFRNPKFREVMNYHINVLGNHAIQKASDSDMRNGRIGIIALRGFRKEFEDADAEYMESKKDEEDFDKHGVLAE